MKIDDIIFVILPLFDYERLPKAFVVPCQRNTPEARSKKIEPMVIHVLASFSFNSTKAVSWNYNATVYVGNKPMILKEPDVINIAGSSSITHNGRVFNPEVLLKKVVEAVAEPP